MMKLHLLGAVSACTITFISQPAHAASVRESGGDSSPCRARIKNHSVVGPAILFT
jgi:hypothetical protein